MDYSNDFDKKNIVKLAHLYFQNGQLDKALAEYRKMLVMDPEDMNTHIILGDIYIKKNAFQVAYESYRKASEGWLSRSQMDKVFLAYKRMAKLDPSTLSQDARNNVQRAQSYIQLDESLKNNSIEEAIEIFGKFLKSRLDDPVVQTKFLDLEMKIAQMPASIEQYQVLGNLFLKNDIFEKAQEMFKKIVVLAPQDVSARSNLASVYLKQGAESEAKKEYLSIAEEAFARSDWEQAFEFAQKAISLKSLEAHYVLGMICFKQQKWMEAKNEFEKLLRIKVSHLGALTYLGKSLDLLSQKEKAAEIFNKALQIDKNDEQVQKAWIEFCVKHKDKETAIPYLTVLLDKAMVNNELEQAVRFSKIMAQLDSQLVLPQIRLVQLLQKLGDLNGAADACCALALIYDKRKNYAEAAVYLEKALELSPANAELLEKALLETRQKALPTPPPLPTPILTLVEPSVSMAESLAPAKVMIETEHHETMGQAGLEETPKPSPEAFTAQMATAEQCIKQGLLKAAIEIYQQLLRANPDSVELKKLNSVNQSHWEK